MRAPEASATRRAPLVPQSGSAPRPGAEKGFTLLEVIVALSILAVSLTVTMQLISGGFTNISRVSQYFMAGSYAQNIMNELLVNPEVLDGYSMNGSFDEGYRWQAMAMERVMPPDPQAVSQLAVGQDQAQLFPLRLLDLEVVIQWKYRKQEHQYVLRCAKVINSLQKTGPLGLGSGLVPGQLPSANPSGGLFGPGGARRPRKRIARRRISPGI